MKRQIIYIIVIITCFGCSKGSDSGTINNPNPPAENPPQVNYNNLVYVGPASDAGIYTQNESGSNKIKILTLSGSDAAAFPNWSSDQRIYFSGKLHGNDYLQLYSMKPDGSDLMKITNHPDVEYSQLQVSSSKHLLYLKKSVGDTSPSGMYTSNLDGSNEVKIMDIADYTVSSMSWYPKVDKIIYVSNEADSSGSDHVSNMYAINTDGTGKVKLTRNTNPLKVYNYPYFCPDGSLVAFVATQDSTLYGYSVYYSGSDLRNENLLINSATKSDSWKTGNWSNNNTWILVTDQSDKLFKMASDGSSKQSIGASLAQQPKYKNF